MYHKHHKIWHKVSSASRISSLCKAKSKNIILRKIKGLLILKSMFPPMPDMQTLVTVEIFFGLCARGGSGNQGQLFHTCSKFKYCMFLLSAVCRVIHYIGASFVQHDGCSNFRSKALKIFVFLIFRITRVLCMTEILFCTPFQNN